MPPLSASRARSARLWSTCAGLVLASGACSYELEGSTPVLDARVEDAARFDAYLPDSTAVQMPDATQMVGGDAGETTLDAGPDPVALTCTPALRALGAATIAHALALDDGPADLALDPVLVTYVQPAVGDMAVGFYIQALADGPALFVAIPANELEPAPEPGDCIRLQVTELDTWNGLREVRAIGAYERIEQGHEVGALQQDLTTRTLAAGFATYAHQLVSVEAVVVTDFEAAATGEERAWFVTEGVPATGALRVRIPAELVHGWTLAAGCELRLRGIVQPSIDAALEITALMANDIEVRACPAPQVLSARALSATTLLVRLDRKIDPSTVISDGSQLAFSGGLTASAMAVTGDGTGLTVITATQLPFSPYEVSVDETLLDVLGASVQPDADTAAFLGHGPTAVVRINEINANIASDCDLVELRVTSGGSMDALELWTRGLTPLATFADLIVSTNDFIVVHFGTNMSCATGVVEETLSPVQHPQMLHAGNLDGAYDRLAPGILSSAPNVLTIRRSTGEILDAAIFADAQTGTVAAATEEAALTIAQAGAWTAPDGTVPEGGFVDDAFRANAVLDSNATGTTRTGTSMQRIDNIDRNTRDDWDNTSTTPASWGALNLGQTEL